MTDSPTKKPRRSKSGVVALDEMQSWGPCRRKLAKILGHSRFDLAMGVVIFANVVIMIIEANAKAPCTEEEHRTGESDDSKCERKIVTYSNWCFLGIYTVEASFRLFCYRCATFRSGWNMLDMFIVLTGWFDLVVTLAGDILRDMPGSNMAMLRLLRSLRILRTMRVFEQFPELSIMLRSFISAVKAMIWGVAMIVVLLLMFAILSVELVHPITLRMKDQDQYCTEAFSTVWYCVVVFFQALVAGDSWGRCAVPVIKEEWWTVFIFLGALMCVQLGFMNLILAAIVENAAESRAASDEEKIAQKNETRRKASERLLACLMEMDADQSGTISIEEFMGGYDANEEMQYMFNKFDMSRQEVETLFVLLDEDGKNELAYEHLVQNLQSCQDEDARKSMTILRLQTSETVRNCKKLSAQLQEVVRLLPDGDRISSQLHQVRTSLRTEPLQQRQEPPQHSSKPDLTDATPIGFTKVEANGEQAEKPQMAKDTNKEVETACQAKLAALQTSVDTMDGYTGSQCEPLPEPGSLAKAAGDDENTEHLNDPVSKVWDPVPYVESKGVGSRKRLAALLKTNHLSVQKDPTPDGEVSLNWAE